MMDSIDQLEQRAARGDAEAQFQLANRCHAEGENARCVSWLRAASEKQHVKAMTNLAICYYFGDGVTQSYNDACALFQQASTLGDVSAKYYLGLCYLNGEGVLKDRSRGFEILLACAAQRLPWAQLAVADCYQDGSGTDVNLFEAVSWYARAAEQGIEDARKFDDLYYSTHFTDFDGSQRLFWFERQPPDMQYD